MVQRRMRSRGWVPDLPDQRDHPFAESLLSGDLPMRLDLKNLFPAVTNQGDLSHKYFQCTRLRHTITASIILANLICKPDPNTNIKRVGKSS